MVTTGASRFPGSGVQTTRPITPNQFDRAARNIKVNDGVVEDRKTDSETEEEVSEGVKSSAESTEG